MRRRRESRLALVTTLAGGLLLGALLPGAQGAGPRQRTDALRHEQSALSTRSHSTLLSLYALDSRLSRARAEAGRLRARSDALRAEQARVAHEVGVAKQSLHAAQDRLGSQLRRLYEQGQPDALAVVLGATSVEDAFARLDELTRSAHQGQTVVIQTRAARAKLTRLAATLAAQVREAQELATKAEQTAATLARARASRVSYLASLARRQRLNARQITSLEHSARQIVEQAQLIVPARPADGVVETPSAQSGRTITVSSTGYSLSGHTATGMPVGWGVVAVDPSVIPLGTRLTIPGYGEGVAADVGGAVQGSMIDLWFPTEAQALVWGRRTVTITLH